MTFFLCVHKDGVCSNTCMIKCNAQFYYIFCYRSGTQRWGYVDNSCIKCTNAQFYYIFCYRYTKMAYVATHALSILTHNFIKFFLQVHKNGICSNTCIKYINAQFYYIFCYRYTKMGYAGNTEPQFIMPSAIAIKEAAGVGDQAIRRLGKGVEDLDFYIGDEALNQPAYSVKVSGRKEGNVLFNDALNTFYLRLYGIGHMVKDHSDSERKEGNVLFNNALNTFYLRLYGVRHMVKDHSDSGRGNPLLPHRLLLPISSKGSFICIILQTG